MDRRPPVTEYRIVVASYPDATEARRAYGRLKDTCSLLNTEEIDVAIVGRSDTGEIRLLRRHEFTTTFGESVEPGWGIATGLALALFPASAEGTGFKKRDAGESAVLSTISESVRGALGWEALRSAGEQIEANIASVVAAFPSALCNYEPPADSFTATATYLVRIDLAAVHDQINHAYREATT